MRTRGAKAALAFALIAIFALAGGALANAAPKAKHGKATSYMTKTKAARSSGAKSSANCPNM